MNVLESLRIALGSLSANRMRALLTMLGVIIGVAAVIALMGIGRGVEEAIASQIEGLGTNLLFVTPGSISQGGVRSAAGSAATLTLDDAEALADPLAVPSVAFVSPELSAGAQVVAQGQNVNARITGVTDTYEWVRNTPVASGEFITPFHVEARSMVAVLGSEVALELFGDADPVGQMIFMNRSAFRVIGVLEPKGGSAAASMDRSVLVPIASALLRLQRQSFRGGNVINSITVQVADRSLMDEAKEEIAEVLRERHRVVQEDDFQIMSQEDFIATATQITGIMTLFLAAIAGISLVVGGIGIMNIMLVSVTERTREIGIRKAVGAKQRDILMQFLVEAVALSLTGGLLGVLAGAGIGEMISGINLGGTALNSVVRADMVMLAVLFSAAVGLFFGVYPAWRAAQLNPIDALRYE